MKITLLSTYDKNGGAAIACIRMAKALLEFGLDVSVLTMVKQGTETFIHETQPLRRCINPILRHGQYAIEKRLLVSPGFQFSGNPWIGFNVAQHPAVIEADVIQLHWINQGFLGIPQLEQLFRLKKPITWHMHDMWPFTGGCHYSGNCTNFIENCGNCPALRRSFTLDKSFNILKSKSRIFDLNPPVLIGASRWLASEAHKSKLGQNCPIAHIPNPIFTKEYSPGDRFQARFNLGVRTDKKTILFAAMNTTDPRKGFRELTLSLDRIKTNKIDIEILIAGKASKELLGSLPFPVHLLGSLSAEKMKWAYQASDLFVIPSLEENLPNTIMESLACGTPVAGFRTGGIPEMVDEGQNGYLANTGDIHQLAQSILNTLNHPDPESLSKNAIKKVNNTYLPELIANSYSDLFNDLVSGSKTFHRWINK